MGILDFAEKIYASSPFQKKRLSSYLSGCDRNFFQEADDFTEKYCNFLATRGIGIQDVVDAYLKMCNDMLRCQMKFMRTGRYPIESSEQANETVYSSESEMLSYMVGLGISQFLWDTHYQIFSFFGSAIRDRSDAINTYLEIGPGHGLLLKKALEMGERIEQAVAIDISPTSLALTEAMIAYAMPGKSHVRYVLGDIMYTDLGGKFDFIALGEVLEHVDRPGELLARIKQMLASDGRCFISTCVNCPAIDHVYQFDTVDQIRELVASNGLVIEKERALPVEDISVEDAESRKITINYCAILR